MTNSRIAQAAPWFVAFVGFFAAIHYVHTGMLHEQPAPVDASLVLYASTPDVSADAPFRDTRAPDAVVDTADAPPRRDHHYWCEMTMLTRHGYSGFDAELPDGTHREYLATADGLVRVAPGRVPYDPPATGAFRTERTTWGTGHVGQRALIDGTWQCYEFANNELRPTTCHESPRPSPRLNIGE